MNLKMFLVIGVFAIFSPFAKAQSSWQGFISNATKWEFSNKYSTADCSLLGTSLEGQVSGASVAANIGWLFGNSGESAKELGREAIAEQGECIQKVLRKHSDGLMKIVKSYSGCKGGIEAIMSYSNWWGKNVVVALSLKVKSDDISVKYKEKSFQEIADKYFNEIVFKSKC